MSDADAHSDLSTALEALPLFPLPQTVLFPGALLPLHVFEERYKKMIRDCLAGHKTLSVVLITGGGRGSGGAPRATAEVRDESGHPAIAAIAGVGTIVDHVELSEGRFNILLRGRARVRLEELPFEPPYRRARGTIVPADDRELPERELAALVSNAAAFAALVRERDKTFELRLPTNQPPGVLADICAQMLVIDAFERQTILETPNLRERVARVVEAIALQRLALQGSSGAAN